MTEEQFEDSKILRGVAYGCLLSAPLYLLLGAGVWALWAIWSRL